MQPTSQYMPTQGQVEMQMPWYVNVLEDLPGVPTVALVNANRTANTLLYGGRSARRVGAVTGMASQTFNPLNAFRFSTDDFLFNPSKTMGPGATYTPYGAARMANIMLDRWGKKDGFRFEEGFLGRVSASAKLNNMSAGQFDNYVSRATGGGGGMLRGQTSGKFLGQMGGASNLRSIAAGSSMSASRIASRGALLGGGAGRASGFVAGALDYVDDAAKFRAGGGATSAAQKALGSNASKQAMKGLGAARNLAAKAAGKGAVAVGSRVGLRAAAYGSAAIPGGQVIAGAMLAYDIARLGVKVIGYGARLISEGIESKNRGMNTPIGGRMHIDTQASLTSRARGVQAIQNSRLNARSVLGSEASSMHSYYG